MAKQVKLTATRRTGTGRSAVRKIKAQGAVPAVIYGGKAQAGSAAGLEARYHRHAQPRLGRKHSRRTRDRRREPSRLALVQEVQHRPLGGDILHVDFHAVSMDEMIEADVPLEPTGTAKASRISAACSSRTPLARDRMSAARFAGCRSRSMFPHLNIGDSIHVRDCRCRKA